MSTFFLCLLLLLRFAHGAEIQGVTYCVEGYALCSAAHCEAIPGDPQHVLCQCQGPFEGLNVGNDTCKSRAESLTSTFSLANQITSTIPPQAPLYQVHCTGKYAGKWASCFDAPCSTASGSVTCICPLMSVSDNFFLSEACPTTAEELSAACSGLKSAALPEAYAHEAVLQSFYGNPPSYRPCPLP